MQQHVLKSSTIALALIGGITSQTVAGEVEKTLSMGGHVNRVIVVADNGESTTLSQIDGSSVSGSRFRVTGSAKSESMTISAITELGLQANPSTSSHTQGAASSLNIRHSYVSVMNSMGTLSIGHTGNADNDLTAMNLNGTGEAGFYTDSVIVGEELRVSGNTGTASGLAIGDVLTDSGSSRTSTIKYQSPTVAGFNGAVGFSHDDHASARLSYGADYDGTKVVATAGWGSRGATAAVDAVWGGSMGISLAGGLNGSVAYSRRDLNGAVTANAGLNDPEMLGASIGYTSGVNGITAWYQQVEDLGANGNQAETYALVVQHNLVDYGTSLYGGIQNVDYSTSTTRYDDLTAGWVGIKVRF